MLELAMSTWVSLRSPAIVRVRSGGKAYPGRRQQQLRTSIFGGQITAPECDHESIMAVSIVFRVVTGKTRMGIEKLTRTMRK